MTAKELIEEMHPGRTLLKDVAEPLGLSMNALAKRLHVPARRLNDIVRGRRGVFALPRSFGLTCSPHTTSRLPSSREAALSTSKCGLEMRPLTDKR